MTKVGASTTVTPERFVAALTDFGPGRGELWGNSGAGYLELHDRGEDWAEVTEGSSAGGGIWQRYRYDWSRPGVVRLEVLDSNLFGPGSWWEYRLAPAPGGGTRVGLTIRRVPASLKARLVDAVLSVYGPIFFGRDLRRTLARLEAAGRAA